jgi:hypothetical protein
VAVGVGVGVAVVVIATAAVVAVVAAVAAAAAVADEIMITSFCPLTWRTVPVEVSMVSYPVMGVCRRFSYVGSLGVPTGG